MALASQQKLSKGVKGAINRKKTLLAERGANEETIQIPFTPPKRREK